MSRPLNKLWRESSSVILLARNINSLKINNFNYKVLLLERPTKTSYAGAYVFPGGIAEKSDHTNDWLSYYQKFGVDKKKFEEITKLNRNRHSLLYHHENSSSLHKDISLRITAIRETFEEIGVLVCKTKEQLSDKNSLFAEINQDFDVSFWQNEVSKDSTKFLKLCETLNVVPDLWGLYEWSAWLTPTDKPSRFFTAFYVVGLNQQVNVHVSSDEVHKCSWHTPTELLEWYKSNEIWLPPPQFYEITRLSKETDIDKLLEFSKKRNLTCDTTVIFPLYFNTADGIVQLYPGDDFYPENPDYYKTSHDMDEHVHRTCEEFRLVAINIHRLEHTTSRHSEIHQNITPLDEHLSSHSHTNDCISKL